MEIGLYSFGDTYPNPHTGLRQSALDNLRELLERIRLADRLGLDYFGLGEHHRPDFSVSACSTVLAAAAATTTSIKLGSAVIVLPTDDPVRLYEQFATLDLLSSGRTELGVGSGGFLESYKLHGLNFEDRYAIFDEKIELLAAIDASETVSFSGETRSPLIDAVVWPRPYKGHLSIWQATAVDEPALARAARLGLSVQIMAQSAQLGELGRLVDVYRASSARAGWSAERRRVTLGAYAYIDDSERKAIDTFFPHYQAYVANMRVNRDKPAPTREQYEETVADLNSNIIVGDAESVARKLAHQHRVVGHDRHIFQIDWRAVPHVDQIRAIEILAHEIAPAVRARQSDLVAAPH
ncbi:LLM class flavin-dependent oxidoreductase [Hyphomicrobium sp. 802]|uniref:LLM class flavin-dependent oxidoreductase n=1 Tax=Hyphomicrobium sp. 802 TaxID=1112272 RepID=UPI00045E8CBA|nr:LLM class flavin-dependent oxidoreductase [Hyphomicrobium sp. 802]